LPQHCKLFSKRYIQRLISVCQEEIETLKRLKLNGVR